MVGTPPLGGGRRLWHHGRTMVMLVVAVYLLALLAIGWWCHRTRIGGMTDFLLAGRRLGVPLCAGAMAATHFGGGAVMGGAAYGFEHGLAGAWYGIATGVGLLALALATARRFRALALYTVPEWLEGRYSSRGLRLAAALLSLAALVGILAAQVNAARAAFAVTGLDPLLAAVLATAVFVAYTAFGGLWAAAVSDLVQIVIAGAGVVLAAVVVLVRVGGVEGLRAALAGQGVGPEALHLTGQGPAFVAWVLVPTVMYTLIGQDFYQRLFAARSPAVARTSAIVGGLVLVALAAAPVVVGMGARALGGVEVGERALPWVLHELLPPVLGGVILAAILAAVMSTADSLLTAATSHVVRDLWPGGRGAEASVDEARMLVVSRSVTVAVGLAALLLGLALPGIVTLLVASYTLYTAGVFVPVLGGLVVRRAGAPAAVAALAAGLTVALLGLLGDLHVGEVPTEVFAALVGAGVFAAVALVTPRRRAADRRQ